MIIILKNIAIQQLLFYIKYLCKNVKTINMFEIEVRTNLTLPKSMIIANWHGQTCTNHRKVEELYFKKF